MSKVRIRNKSTKLIYEVSAESFKNADVNVKRLYEVLEPVKAEAKETSKKESKQPKEA